MARSLTELMNLTQPDLLVGIIDSLKKNDELSALLFSNAGITDRYQIKFNQLASVPSPVVADCSTTLTSQNISASPMSVNLLTKVTQFDVCAIGQNLYSSFTDVFQSELIGAVKGFTENIVSEAVGSGDGTSALLGLGSNVTLSQTISAGGSFTLDDLDVLVDTVLDKGPSMAFIGSPAAVRAIVRELRAGSALNVLQLMDTTFNVPTYLGYPILKSADVPAGVVYLVNLDTGYKVYLGSNPEQKVGGIFGLEDLGPSQTKLSHLWRLTAHMAGVTLNPLGIAKINGVI